MQAYLSNVLLGDVDMALVKRWITEGTDLPPALSAAKSPRSPTSTDQWPLMTADHFRVSLLNHVKEEADKIFLAAEQQAVAVHQQAVTSRKAAKDAHLQQATSQPSAPPGIITDSSFPTLSMMPTKKNALDRRLSVRQPSSSAGQLTQTAAPAQKNRSRKIAPTLVQTDSRASSFPNLLHADAVTTNTPSQTFASPPQALNAEASARDLWTCGRPVGDIDAIDDEVRHVQQQAQHASPLSAWPRPHTPSTGGSTARQHSHARQDLMPPQALTSHRRSASPAASHLTTHSAPAAAAHARGRGKSKRISPSPLGDPTPQGHSSACSPQLSAWPSVTANSSPTISTSTTAAWCNRSPGQAAVSSTAQSSIANGAARSPLSEDTAAMQQGTVLPARSSAWGQSSKTAQNVPSVVTPNRSSWSSPGPQPHQGRMQHSGPRTPSGAHAVASPGSTATSRLQPAREDQNLLSTPVSQVRSESGSTGTEYATPPSTLKAWRDMGSNESFSSPEGRGPTPKGQRLSTQLDAAAASASCATAQAPADKAINSSTADGRRGSLPEFLSEDVPQPSVPESALAVAVAQLDQLAAEHPRQVEEGNANCPAPVLTEEDRRLAELHAHIIAVVSSVSLAAELDLLLHLVALPPAITCHPSAETQQPPRFKTGAIAVLYAGQVLSLLGRLVSSLGTPLLECLAAVPVLQDHSPALMALLNEKLEADAELVIAPERGYDRASSISSQLFGAGAFTQDGQRQRSQEEQRKVSDMNDCRDSWAQLMRTAADQQAGQLRPPVSTQAKGSLHDFDGSSAGVLLYMQQHARKPLRALRHDNYATFADLFTAALLQAAATGETLLESDQSEAARALQKLADKDASKVFRLNQRMQGQAAGHRPSHQGRYSTNSGGVRSGGSSPFQSPGVTSQHSQAPQSQFSFYHQLGSAHGHRMGNLGTMSEADIADLALAMQFPQAQRPFLMFLQAADSHRLNLSLIRCMNALLQQMHQSSLHEAAASHRVRSERLVSQCCLASFLSYLTFTLHAGTSPSNSNHGSSSQMQPGTDLKTALHAAAVGNSLEWVIPWVVQYVRFVSQDSAAQQSAYIQQVLQRLLNVQRCKALLTGSPQFGPVAACLRCILDDHLERSAEVEFAEVEVEADADWLGALQGWESIADLRRSVLDARYLQLCCPLLEQARQAIQASISAENGRWDVRKAKLKGVRKITPSQPQGSSPQVRSQVPSRVAAAAASSQTDSDEDHRSVKLRLQQAFLAQYSPSDAKVRLKDIVDYVTGIIAHNAVLASLDSCLPQLLASAAADFALQAKAAVQRASAHTDSQASNAGSSKAGVTDHTRMCISALSEEVLESSVTKTMDVSFAAAEKYIESQSVRALAALAPPTWTQAVVGTAAAMILETARPICAKQLIQEVAMSGRKRIQQQLDSTSSAVMKSIGNSAHQAS